MKLTKHWFLPLIHLFFPRYCAACGRRLQEEEIGLCKHCWEHLPRTNYHLQEDSLAEKLFWGKFPLGRVTAYYHYRPGSSFAEIVHLIKYRNRPELGITMGRLMAEELMQTSFFEGVDLLIPVPLHKKRFRQRGYNQSERLATGISQLTAIPVATNLVSRNRHTETQTHKTAQERYENMRQVFQLDVSPEILTGKHVMLVDDVLTTSATLTACADVFKDIPDITISILTLAVAGH